MQGIIPQSWVPHPMYAKNAQSTPTHQQEVTNKQTAFATLGRQAWTVNFAWSVWLESSRQ